MGCSPCFTQVLQSEPDMRTDSMMGVCDQIRHLDGNLKEFIGLLNYSTLRLSPGAIPPGMV